MKLRSATRHIITIGISLAAVVSLAACGSQTSAAEGSAASSIASVAGTTSTTGAEDACVVDTKRPIAFVASGRSNQPTPRLADASRPLIDEVFDSKTSIAVVSTSGDPVVVAQGPIASDAANSAAIAEDRGRAFATVEAAIQAEPASPEADLIGAMTLAERWLDSTEGATLVVADSGLATSGALDYRTAGLLGADPTDVATYLADTQVLPDLTGLTVIFTGLGDTVAPQEPLSESTRRHLVAQYEEIARASGAACVTTVQAPSSGPAPKGAPSVSTVTPPAPLTWTGDKTDDVVLTDDVVGFLPGTAKFRDPASAGATLQTIAAALSKTPGRVTLTGTTANWGSRAYQRRLSLARSKAISALLVRAGIDPHRITTRGLGSNNRWYVRDHDAAGHLLPGPASVNRAVRISVR